MNKHNYGKPIFGDFLKHIDSPPHSDAIIAVFHSGQVFLIPIDDNRDNYLVNPFAEIRQWFEPTIKADTPEAALLRRFFNVPHIGHSTCIRPRCIGSLQLCRKIEMIRIEFTNDGSNFLIVYGIIDKNVPSIGVYKITSDCMTLIYTDSLLAISDFTYSSYYKSFIFIPRLSNTSIGILSIPNSPPKYKPRVIPEIVFAGSHLKRTVHLCPAGCHKWQVLSWSDDICPSIIAWHFSPPGEPEKLWTAQVINLLIPCFIQFLSYDTKTDKLGFIIQDSSPVNNDENNNNTENKTNSDKNSAIICVWDLEKKHIEQYNLLVPNIDKVLSAKWATSVVSSEVVFTVSTSTGYYEHQKNQVMRWAKPIGSASSFLCDDYGNRFYFNEQGELKVVTAPVFYEQINLEKVDFQKVAPYPIVHNFMKGECDSLSCLHMYRCAGCKRPLLYPLVSKSPEYHLENCYCCSECQMAHWPSFVAVNQPLNFQCDIDS